MNSGNSRRTFICSSAVISTGFVLSACSGNKNTQSGKHAGESGAKENEKEEGGEVTATEDLMR